MKKVLLISALIGALTCAAAEKIRLTDAPEAVQKAILAERGAQAKVDGITIVRRNTNEQPQYEVEFKEPGRNPKLLLSADGKIIKENRAAEKKEVTASSGISAERAASGKNRLLLKDLPQPVQDAIVAQKGAANVDGIKIRQAKRKGKSVYRVEFEEKGKNVRLELDEAGAILRDNRK